MELMPAKLPTETDLTKSPQVIPVNCLTLKVIKTNIQTKIKLFLLLELFLDGKFECSGVLADTLCKLMIRLKKQKRQSSASASIDVNQFTALRTRVLMILTSVLRLGGSKYPLQPIDSDSAERIALCIQILINENGNENKGIEESILERALTVDSELAFNSIQQGALERVAFNSSNSTDINSFKPSENYVSIDDLIDFKLISTLNFDKKSRAKKLLSSAEALSLVLNDSSVNENKAHYNGTSSNSSSLNRVVQLTGFSDVIYAETYVQMTGKEVLLDLLLVNQTEDTLQNVSIDLVCAGDLKLIEKPPQLTLPPFSFSAGKAIFKVTATNHGQIFGCISFHQHPHHQNQSSPPQESESVILSEIKIDVLEYIKPGFISEPIFREAWVLLEWENKISIKVQHGGELKDFLGYLLKNGHLTCITPNVFIESERNASLTEIASDNIPAFLACNLYAKSIFGKHILIYLYIHIYNLLINYLFVCLFIYFIFIR